MSAVLPSAPQSPARLIRRETPKYQYKNRQNIFGKVGFPVSYLFTLLFDGADHNAFDKVFLYKRVDA